MSKEVLSKKRKVVRMQVTDFITGVCRKLEESANADVMDILARQMAPWMMLMHCLESSLPRTREMPSMKESLNTRWKIAAALSELPRAGCNAVASTTRLSNIDITKLRKLEIYKFDVIPTQQEIQQCTCIMLQTNRQWQQAAQWHQEAYCSRLLQLSWRVMVEINKLHRFSSIPDARDLSSPDHCPGC